MFAAQEIAPNDRRSDPRKPWAAPQLEELDPASLRARLAKSLLGRDFPDEAKR